MTRFRYEPVVILDTLKYLLVSLTALGVWHYDSSTTEWVVGVVGSALALISTFVTRKKVTPTARVVDREVLARRTH